MPTVETAADLRGPYNSPINTDGSTEIAVVAVTASTQVIDLSSSSYFNSTNYQERFVRLISDVLIYYYWSNASGALLDETATAGTTRAQQCDMLPANTPREEAPAGRYLVIKGSTGKCRVSITNQVSR